MTQHQNAQQYAKEYYQYFVSKGSDLGFAWQAAMMIFKREMQK